MIMGSVLAGSVVGMVAGAICLLFGQGFLVAVGAYSLAGTAGLIGHATFAACLREVNAWRADCDRGASARNPT
ncbi:hypothetical protein [Frigidibacter sp. SD6-1]|uniref:hypothetical protein n=1 Tax=Frigidibacter sp. SD6-1 TaxID=3032581 RepID=UPI0024DFCB55|nr:hypothetical protein [Frigidibacter sp. SD6-1]